jgi:DNA-binding GntR family transcriptional regulator
VSPNTAWGAYAKIADVLRERFAAKDPGSPLPSEASLCAEFAVVRNTIRRALATLEHEGLIETLPGKGRHVRGDTSAQYHYRRIATDLRTQIDNGSLTPGDALPSEAAIAEAYGVARGTVRAALALLQSEGLIETHHGKGRFVRKCH